MPMLAAITVSGVWKRYGLPLPDAYYRWRTRFRAWRHACRRRVDEVAEAQTGSAVNDSQWALRDVSFSVTRGETVGVIGRNGAGKSTLLKVLAGVTPCTRGRVAVTGRIFSMIELNAGLHSELTGRENVRLLGAIMGLPRADIDRRMPAIEAYCELGGWFDMPVWKYSSGMLARIGFGVAVNVDADVLLVDEVLAVGDLAFQRRCYDRIAQLKKTGVTILLVSHSLRQIERLCDRAVLMDRGQVRRIGPSSEVVDAYFAQTLAGEAARAQADSAAVHEGVDGVQLTGFDFRNDAGGAVEEIRTGEAVTVRMHFRFRDRVSRPVVALGLVTSDMLLAGAVGNEFDATRTDVEGCVTYACRLNGLPLLPGVYGLRVKVRDANTALLLSADRVGFLRVVAGEAMRFGLDVAGLIRLDAAWQPVVTGDAE